MNDDVECMTAEELRVDQNWWSIYEESFPASEREPPEVIVKSVLRGAGMAFRARRDGVTFGLATTHVLRNPPVVFLVYLAVARGDRGRGTGAELLRRSWELGAVDLSKQGLQPLGLVWEVDPPEIGVADAEVRRRRIAFFERNGGQLLDRSFLQPPVNGTIAIPMSLMFRPTEGETLPSTEIVERLVRAIYFEKYGAINGIDEAVLEGILRGR